MTQCLKACEYKLYLLIITLPSGILNQMICIRWCRAFRNDAYLIQYSGIKLPTVAAATRRFIPVIRKVNQFLQRTLGNVFISSHLFTSRIMFK